MSYGAEKIQQKVWVSFAASIYNGSSVLKERLDVDNLTNPADNGKSKFCSARIFLNPCMFVGRKEWVSLINGTVTTEPIGSLPEGLVQFIGSGNFSQCAALVKRVLWPDSDDSGNTCYSVDKRCPIDGVIPPPMEDLHFYGMSAYYYALDCVRELGPDHIAHWYTLFFCLFYV